MINPPSFQHVGWVASFRNPTFKGVRGLMNGWVTKSRNPSYLAVKLKGGF